MKHSLIVLLLFVLFLFFGFNGGGNTQGIDVSENAVKQLQEIVDVMNDHEIKVTEWTIYARENGETIHSLQQYLNHVQKLKRENSHLHWEQQNENGLYKTIATGTINMDEYEKSQEQTNGNTPKIQEQMIYIAYPQENNYKTYFIYKINGETWTPERSAQFQQSFQQTLNKMFGEQPQIFSCASGVTSDNMEGVLYNQALTILKDFSADPIGALQEETFVSVSAYTENWNNSIPEKDKDMNIQIAIRTEGLGALTKVVIGTPIITIEY